jgi:hypothetical protein
VMSAKQRGRSPNPALSMATGLLDQRCTAPNACKACSLAVGTLPACGRAVLLA